MDFLIADTFTRRLAELTGKEKAAKTTAFDLQLRPTSPRMQLHKLDRAKDKNFSSVRVSSDIQWREVIDDDAASYLVFGGRQVEARRNAIGATLRQTGFGFWTEAATLGRRGV